MHDLMQANTYRIVTGIFSLMLIKICMKSVMFRKISANELLMVHALEVKAHILTCFLNAFLDSFSKCSTITWQLAKEIMNNSNQHIRI